MKRNVLICLLGGFSVFILSGCVVRTYSITRDRVDQDLSSGNRGYIMGKAPESQEERSLTRTTQVVEVELRSPLRFEKAKKAPVAKVEEPMPQESNQGYVSSTPAPAAPESAFQKYTVEKNDTLQKISQKFYGTTKKWMKIYDANKDVLKGPNKLRAGQVINIPETSGMKSETLKEPKENLK